MNESDIWEIKKEMMGHDKLPQTVLFSLSSKYKKRPQIIMNIFKGKYMGHIPFPTEKTKSFTYLEYKNARK